jgi:hypothetical protein
MWGREGLAELPTGSRTQYCSGVRAVDNPCGNAGRVLLLIRGYSKKE